MDHAFDYNYAALAVAILKDCTTEHAFDLLEDPNRKSRITKLSDGEIEKMIELKKTHTYDELAEIYGMSKDAVYVKIKRYKQRKDAG